MQPSRFNVHVPIAGTRDVFLMNTLSDAQAIVSDDVLSWLDTGAGGGAAQEPERQEALATLVGQGFLVESREADDQAIARFFADHRERSDELRVTVLTTLQCNFACGYCFQGDHGHFTAHDRMSIETAEGVASWIGQQLDDIGAQRLNVTFFGGEPLLNLPVLYRLAERCSALAGARGVEFVHTVITNGLLLSEEIVDRLLPYGLVGIKVTLDGDRDTHDRLRPLRGGQGTFDRIVANITRVAERCPITIGGNFDVSTLEGYPALLAFLKAQPFAPHLARVSFKPTIRPREPRPAGRLIPLIPVDGGGQSLGTCMSTLGAAGGSPCDSCGFIDEAMSALREATKSIGPER